MSNNTLSSAISSLRNETVESSITPGRLGAILAALHDVSQDCTAEAQAIIAEFTENFEGVLHFAGFASAAARVRQQGCPADGAEMVYHPGVNCFVARREGNLYSAVPGGERYGEGTFNGYRPLSKLIYMCDADRSVYLYNGTALVLLAAGITVYRSGETYTRGQVVSRNNALYLVTATSTTTAPGSSSADYETILTAPTASEYISLSNAVQGMDDRVRDLEADMTTAQQNISTAADNIDDLSSSISDLWNAQPQPYVAGRTYYKDTVVSHNNVLYRVTTATNTTPSPDNGNYTVLVDGGDEAAVYAEIDAVKARCEALEGADNVVVDIDSMREAVMVDSSNYSGARIETTGRIVSANNSHGNSLTRQNISAGTVVLITATNSHATESVTMRMSQYPSVISVGVSAIEGADVDEWVIPPSSTVTHRYYCKVDGRVVWGGLNYRVTGYVATSKAEREPYVTVPSKTAFALVRLEPQTLKGVAVIAEGGATQWAPSGFVGIYDVRHLVGRTVVIRGRVEYSSRQPFFGAYSEPTPSADSVMKLSAYRSSSSSGSGSYSQVSEVLKIEEGMNYIAVSCNYATHGVYLVSDATRVVEETPKGEDYDDNMTRAELLKLFGNANDHVWQVAAGKTVGGVTYERDTWIKDSTSILVNRGMRKRIAKLPNHTTSLVGALYTATSLVDASGVVAYGVVGTNLVQVFSGCYSLRRIPHLDTWDTANVTSIYTLCYECYTLETLDLHGWDTSNVVDMHQAFGRCLCLTELNLEGWDMSNVTNTTSMFGECNSLRYIHLSPSFFYGTQTLPFNGARYLGLNEDNETSNGWIEMVAETAPEITDGVERVIGLPTLLKGLSWAQPYIEILNNKGYTIS